jgi:hypothetical protein
MPDAMQRKIYEILTASACLQERGLAVRRVGADGCDRRNGHCLLFRGLDSASPWPLKYPEIRIQGCEIYHTVFVAVVGS